MIARMDPTAVGSIVECRAAKAKCPHTICGIPPASISTHRYTHTHTQRHMHQCKHMHQCMRICRHAFCRSYTAAGTCGTLIDTSCVLLYYAISYIRAISMMCCAYILHILQHVLPLLHDDATGYLCLSPCTHTRLRAAVCCFHDVLRLGSGMCCRSSTTKQPGLACLSPCAHTRSIMASGDRHDDHRDTSALI